MKKIFVFAVMALISFTSFANPWSYHGPKRDIVSLVVTANYEKPRLLAELIQEENRQPFILISPDNSGNFYFCPHPSLGEPKVIARDELLNVIAYIGPKQIVVLGTEKYVPESYVKDFRKIAPVFVATAKSWQKVADTVAPMLNLSRLPRSFRKLNAELESSKLNIKAAPKAAENSDELLFPEEPAPKKAAPVKKSADPEKYPAFDADEKTAPAAPVQKNGAAEVAPLA